MKSALTKRLVFVAGGLLIVVCLFIGVNVGYELPADRVLWFCAAVAVALLLVGYGWYAFARKPGADATTAGPGDARPQARSTDHLPAQQPPTDAAKHAN